MFTTSTQDGWHCGGAPRDYGRAPPSWVEARSVLRSHADDSRTSRGQADDVNRSSMHVVVAGGGFAAAELLLGLRALAEDRVSLEVIAPSPRLVFKPAATGHPFGVSTVQEYDLRELADEVGAIYRADTVEAVAPQVSRLRLASGAVAKYDALVLATGARSAAAVPGATMYRDHRDSGAIARLLGALRAGKVRSVVFTAPSGVAWTLPIYELALFTAKEIDEHDLFATVAIVTPEAAALQVFGAAVSTAVHGLLLDHLVHFVPSTRPRSVSRSGLELSDGATIPADRVIAVPQLTGRRLSGVPAGWSGFVATDDRGRVESLQHVFAAGDMTRFPIKQGGLATQQADVIAAELARRAGADVTLSPVRHVLRTQLFGADGPLFLRVELDAHGHPIRAGEAPSVSTDAPWWPAAKLHGRYLSPWMAARASSVAATASPVVRARAEVQGPNVASQG
jgi:sulfide:quinone oxidoreductase